jgi:hypothetical protein
MSYGCQCGCDREIRHLKDQVRSLEYTIDEIKRDAERSIERLGDHIDSLRSDLQDLQS